MKNYLVYVGGTFLANLQVLFIYLKLATVYYEISWFVVLSPLIGVAIGVGLALAFDPKVGKIDIYDKKKKEVKQ